MNIHKITATGTAIVLSRDLLVVLKGPSRSVRLPSTDTAEGLRYRALINQAAHRPRQSALTLLPLFTHYVTLLITFR